MDPGFLDRLSPDQWYILRAEVELRIRSHEASEIDTANRPHHLLHGAGAGDQPATEPEPYYSQPIIPGDICNIDVDSRLFHQLEDLEATVRTQQVQPVWGGLPPPQPPLSYYSNLGFSANQGIEPLGPGKPRENSFTWHLCVLYLCVSSATVQARSFSLGPGSGAATADMGKRSGNRDLIP